MSDTALVREKEKKNGKQSEKPDGATTGSDAVDLTAPEWYLNRELTWLEFNRRVFSEACDVRNPLLERLFFLSVIGSNLDEFFMKRIGGPLRASAVPPASGSQYSRGSATASPGAASARITSSDRFWKNMISVGVASWA